MSPAHLTRPFVAGEERPPRRIVVLTCLVALLLLPVGSGTAADFEVGASLGVARATIGGNSPPGSGFAARPSGSAAIAIAFPVARDVSLLFEPGYTVRGAKVTVEELDNPEMVDVLDLRLPYIVFPLAIRVASSGGRGFVVGGLEARWLQKAEMELLVDPGTTIDITDRVSSFDLAMNMGAGYNFPWQPVHVSLEVRYSQGLLNLDKGVSEEVDAPFPLRFRTSGLGLILRLMVPLHIGNERG